jgi:hypothetical protein
MTVSSEVSRAGPYTGNGVTVSFAFGFRILDETHIRVVRTEGGVDTDVTTGFTVSGVGSAGGGSITFSVAPTSAQTITIVRDVPQTQEIDLVNQGAYFAEVVEEGFDLATMRDQQLQEQLDRTVKVPVGSNVSNIETLIANVTALAGIAEDISDLAGVTAAISTLASAVSAIAIAAANVTDITNFSAVYLGPRSSNPSTRTDGTALVAGDLFFDTSEQRLKNWTGSAWVLSASSVNGIRSTQAYTATAGQTVFAATYDVGFVDVFLNGVRRRPTVDFTATNGTSITLATGAALNDRVDIVGYGTFALANMLEKSQNGNDIPDKPQFRTNLGLGSLATINSVGVGNIDAAAVRLSSEGLSAPTDAELATAAWAAAYANDRTLIRTRAAVNFNAVALTGTYSRSGSTVTVTMAAHGMTTGQACLFTVQSGGATNNYSAVVTVVDANTFTYTDGASWTTSGNITRRIWLRGFGNVNRIIYNAAGDYTIEFFTAMPTANYVVTGTAVGGSLSNISAGMVVVAGATATGPALKTTTQVRIQVGSSANGIPADSSDVNVLVVI